MDNGKDTVSIPAPDTGEFWFDRQYRLCKLILPDATCDWERTDGFEILVSEPPGKTVPEFFGVSRFST